MTAGRGVRTVRAAVFAAVCVLLAALGHVLMSGSSVPWWTLSAGFGATSAVGWTLAGRERGLPLVVSVVVVVQGALHSAFSWGGSAASGSGTGGMSDGSMSMGSMDAMDMGSAHMGSAHMGHVGHMAHGTGGTSSLGMLAAHTLAALLTGLWLAYGERAAFRLLRAVAGWLAAPLRLPLLALPVPPRRPSLRPTRERAERIPRLTLTHTIISRGPPAGTAVV
ncbi:hypothetical protein ACKI1I_04160 [Streptomyces turgidiscabies]|uniref:Uncharacterized protein n=1 Tax=Streptomyces turgidiscabies (strain Car8) TaxID=698760 RepID=L7FC36_STRT8|nr:MULTISPECIES: hypothetical protein [Streptomyces]ELP68586.1 hypothetical protein STRTUCAR8_03565 [Streptomyces turgidiscabies Car8]MDX3494096.1 hypothetical protein [Streptomyces turgidiscabies]GAQ68533.1 hypothetical protein T45_00244 [Streptomyces turgidiscabies]